MPQIGARLGGSHVLQQQPCAPTPTESPSTFFSASSMARARALTALEAHWNGWRKSRSRAGPGGGAFVTTLVNRALPLSTTAHGALR